MKESKKEVNSRHREENRLSEKQCMEIRKKEKKKERVSTRNNKLKSKSWEVGGMKRRREYIG